MKREYKALYFRDTINLSDELNEYWIEWWEIIAVLPHKEYWYRVFFKREK